MLILTIILLITTTLLGGIFFVLFRWAVKDGQFDDPEEAKYVIFREDEARSEIFNHKDTKSTKVH